MLQRERRKARPHDCRLATVRDGAGADVINLWADTTCLVSRLDLDATAGSVAIDAGNPTGCTDQFGAPLTTDQRGEARPFGTACDLGAFERGNRIFRDSFES